MDRTRLGDRLAELMDRRELVIAASDAAARDLRSAFDRRQQQTDRTTWEPARALAWSQWTASHFSSLVIGGFEARLLLNRVQEVDLWARVIAADAETPSLGLNPDAIADLAEVARQAFSLASSCCVATHLRSSASTRDERVFARWADTFTRTCEQRKLLSSAALDSALGEHTRSGALHAAGALPPTLHLYDFAPTTPAQNELLRALESIGVALERLRPEPALAVQQVWAQCDSELGELRLAARWIRTQLRRDARCRIALVVPNLGEERQQVEVVLRNELAPELDHIDADVSSTPWGFASGAPLAHVSLITAAVSLARWAAHGLPLPDVSRLLLSRYVGHTDERDVAAAFDAQVLRRAGLLEPVIDLRGLLALRQRRAKTAPDMLPAPAWLERLNTALLALDLRSPRSFAEWTSAVRTITAAAGWPGSAPLNAAEFAATRELDGVLDSMATLDATAGNKARRVPFLTALHTLERLLERTPQRCLATDSPVQVLTPDQLDGRSFDAVVFVHATDDHWPGPARPHPLLSRILQREAGAPGVDPERADQEARERMGRLLEGTPLALFLCAKENDEGKLRPSPLLSAFGLPQVASATLIADEKQAAPVELETFQDPMDVQPLPKGVLRGGASVLKSQAACGFLAFAGLRLLSDAPEAVDAGFDARESGSLLHDVLHQFWQRVSSQHELAAMSLPERESLLKDLLSQALARVPQSTPWSAAYIDLMRRRMLRLLLAWLDQEMKRSPFIVVATEQERTQSLGSLELRVRVDRIDETEDGGRVYIDYKTGRVNTSLWEGPRPDDPQLPLYAVLAGDEDIRGVLFANVRAGKQAAWTGVQSELGIFTNGRAKVSDLGAMRESWKTALEQLTDDFYAGRALVSPKSAEVNCVRCAQRLLCRRDAAALLHAELREVDGEESRVEAFALDGESDG